MFIRFVERTVTVAHEGLDWVVMPLEAEAQTVSLGSLATAADLCINMCFLFQPQYLLSEFTLVIVRHRCQFLECLNYL